MITEQDTGLLEWDTVTIDGVDIPVCCQHKEAYVSTPAVVPRKMGAMIMFPAQYTHMVTAYQGQRPRISLAWNINAAPRADKPKHDGVLT